jgi:hypothetical protein
MPQQTDSRDLTLDGDVYDRLLKYQRDGETLQETLERVFLAFVPLRMELEPSRLDPEDVTPETRMVVEHWPDRDGQIMTHTFDSPPKYIKQHRSMAESILVNRASDGDSE